MSAPVQQNPEVLNNHPPVSVMDQVAFGSLPDLAAPVALHETVAHAPIIAQERQPESGSTPQTLIGAVAIAGAVAYGVYRHRSKNKTQTWAAPDPATRAQDKSPSHNTAPLDDDPMPGV